MPWTKAQQIDSGCLARATWTPEQRSELARKAAEARWAGQMRVCTKCDRTLPITAFYKRSREKNTRHWRCYECHANKAREQYHDKNPDAKYRKGKMPSEEYRALLEKVVQISHELPDVVSQCQRLGVTRQRLQDLRAHAGQLDMDVQPFEVRVQVRPERESQAWRELDNASETCRCGLRLLMPDEIAQGHCNGCLPKSASDPDFALRNRSHWSDTEEGADYGLSNLVRNVWKKQGGKR